MQQFARLQALEFVGEFADRLADEGLAAIPDHQRVLLVRAQEHDLLDRDQAQCRADRGLDPLQPALRRAAAQLRRQAREQRIERLPDGVYQAEDWVEYEFASGNRWRDTGMNKYANTFYGARA